MRLLPMSSLESRRNVETNNSIHTAAARSLIRIKLNKDSAIELDTLSKEYTTSTLFANNLQTVCKPALSKITMIKIGYVIVSILIS